MTDKKHDDLDAPPTRESIAAAKEAAAKERKAFLQQVASDAQSLADRLALLEMVERWGPERIARWLKTYTENA